MEVQHRRVIIDAHPHGPLGPWAWQPVGDRSSLARLLAFATECDSAEVCVHSAYEDTPHNVEIAERHVPPERALRVTSEPVPDHGFVLRTDRVYDPARLRVALRQGQSPESAVVWRLNVKSDLVSASDELTRRTTYQPVGRHWAWSPARAIAERLQPTKLRPNHVTALAAAAFLGAAALVAFGGASALAWSAAAGLLALALVLDTSDGHLARLQGTASDFGRWLDATLDELCDVALHAAIAWSVYAQTQHPLWLVLGMAYIAGKYLFVVACQNAPSAADQGPQTASLNARDPRSALRAVVQWLAHADIRWHAWIALAALGQLKWALVAYAAYYPLRAAAVARRWVVIHD